jgi:protein-disulfide isomerase
MDKRFMGILGILVVIFLGIFIISQRSSGSPSTSSSSAPTNNVEGQGAKGVTLIEYGDFECPICGEFYQPMKQVFTDNSQNIYFQFRNLPLVSLHPNAFSGARAAQAAALQGKFWQMHDKLYDNQTQWAGASNPVPFFQNYAQEIGLNMGKYNSDYSSTAVNNSINADLAAFAKTGQQQATPTFFLDGKVLDNTQFIDPQTGTVSVTKFDQAIAGEIALKAKTKS